MNEAEYRQWEMDARSSLSGKYSEEEIGTIIRWFKNIKGRHELDLAGSSIFDSMLNINNTMNCDETWSLYNSLMCRLWVYAPYILKEDEKEILCKQ